MIKKLLIWLKKLFNRCFFLGSTDKLPPPLSKEEELNYVIKYQNGDLKAKEKLIEGNLKLVLSILKKYNNGKHNIDDLFQVGVVGLIKAIDNFDLSYNLMFSTYAVTLIMGEIRRYIRDNTPFRVSRSIKELSYSILAFKESKKIWCRTLT